MQADTLASRDVAAVYKYKHVHLEAGTVHADTLATRYVATRYVATRYVATRRATADTLQVHAFASIYVCKQIRLEAHALKGCTFVCTYVATMCVCVAADPLQ